jgi:hypothetical protein
MPRVNHISWKQYTIDPLTHIHLANRRDGVPVDPRKY